MPKTNDFINFWEFLGIPMNSPLAVIKKAYYIKFTEIEKSLDNKESKYTPNDLIIVNKAYATLSNPYERYLHNCQIDDEDPGDIRDFDFSGETEDDLPDSENQVFLNWLKHKTEEYFAIADNKSNIRSLIVWFVERHVFKDIAKGLLENYTKLQQNIQSKKRQNKRTLHM